MKLSVIVPARNESSCVTGTVTDVLSTLRRAGIPRELLTTRPVKQETFRKATDCDSISCLLLDPNLSGSDQIRIRTRHQIRVRSIQGGALDAPFLLLPVPIPVRLLLILGRASATH
jgi:hypothetical protein